MTRPLLSLVVAVSMTAAAVADAEAAFNLQTGTRVRLVDPPEAARLLRVADGWVKALSPFDRAARLKTDSEVSQAQFLEFVGKQARPWTEAERTRLLRALAEIRKRLAPYRLPLPKQIEILKTTGVEEWGAAYCRGNAIVFPQQVLGAPEVLFQQLLAHELFHIMSRNDVALQRKLYAIVGFKPCPPVAFPEALAARKITNPDAYELDYSIELEPGVRAVPILFANRETYDVARGGGLFSYLVSRLLVIADKGEPKLLEPAKTPAYMAQVGRNTPYIIHPEEVLADNFKLMLFPGRPLPTPRIVAEMKRLLQRPER